MKMIILWIACGIYIYYDDSATVTMMMIMMNKHRETQRDLIILICQHHMNVTEYVCYVCIKLFKKKAFKKAYYAHIRFIRLYIYIHCKMSA